jgi:hypothetical protein
MSDISRARRRKLERSTILPHLTTSRFRTAVFSVYDEEAVGNELAGEKAETCKQARIDLQRIAPAKLVHTSEEDLALDT